MSTHISEDTIGRLAPDGAQAARLDVEKSRLRGEVAVSGAKNSALRLLAASILTFDKVHLRNYPAGLLDARIHVRMLEALGKTCVVGDDEIIVSENRRLDSTLVWQGRSIRNTLLILGALLARTGRGAVPLPGGCRIGDHRGGDRKYDLHELVMHRLGARTWLDGDMLCAEAPEGLTGADIELPIRSTGATENAILCGSLARGITRIRNPHVRPEILDLIRMLRKMGVRIFVHGQESIEVHGAEGLSGVRHRVVPDSMEALTWLIASVVTDGDLEIHDFPFADLEVPLIFLRESGAKFYRGERSLVVRSGRCLPLEVSTGPYPGINSDMQPLFAVYGACAAGQSRIVDLRFPGRYGYAAELGKLGVRYEVVGNLLRIFGGAPLRAADVQALDLRAGVALLLAGLVADGVTRIHDAWQIQRGYADVFAKLASLGARFHVEPLVGGPEVPA